MPFQTNAILQIYTQDPSIPGFASSTFSGPYVITDHNRAPLDIGYERIEKSDRMADGTMRRFITANKKKISTSWKELPAAGGINFTADGNIGGAFLKSFYEENVYNPVWIQLTYAEESWRFNNTTDPYSLVQAKSNNETYKRSVENNSTASSYFISSASIQGTGTSNAITGPTNATASIATAVIPRGIAANQYINISGLDSFLNGTFKIKTVDTNNKLISFDLPNPMFVINSYTQTATTATFNVDMTYWIKAGSTFKTYNTTNISGATINNVTWTVTGLTTNTITATCSSPSQTANGRGGVAILQTSASNSKSYGSSYIPTFTPAISTDIIKCFITNFDYSIVRRLTYTDYVDLSIEFTEI